MNEQDKYKQVIVVRRKYTHPNGEQFGMRLGKIVAQACHASNGAAFLSKGRQYDAINVDQTQKIRTLIIKIPDDEIEWYFEKFTKATLQVDSEAELLELRDKAKEAGLPFFLVCDEGVTEFKGQPTHTCIAIGPALSSEIDKITGNLKLL